MDRRPIGVFDSGLGGLTAVRELQRILPHEDIVYFGDTGRVPYGTRAPDTILRYTRQDIRFLRSFSVKALVIACGTASSVALPQIEGEYDLPILGVVSAAAQKAVNTTKNKRIGLLGTAATVASGSFARAISAQDSSVSLTAIPCPLFVPLVENGRVSPSDPVLRLVVEEYLTPMREAGVDTLILGCTHYPIIAEAIGNFMGDAVTLINPSREAIETLAALKNVPFNANGVGSCRFYVSDDPVSFAKNASLFLGRQVHESVEQITLEETL